MTKDKDNGHVSEMNMMLPCNRPSPQTRPTARRRRVPTAPVMLLASLFPVVIVIVLASVVAFASGAETTTVPPTTDANNDDANPSCVSLSTSERDCLLTTTSNICEWIYDDITGTTACQEMVTTTTTTSTIILTNILPENYTYTRPPRNEIRYTPWNELSRELQVLATGSFRYTKLTWDTLGTNSIELLRYDDLSEDQKEAARELGFDDSFSWNCWQVRYIIICVAFKASRIFREKSLTYLLPLLLVPTKESLGGLLVDTVR